MANKPRYPIALSHGTARVHDLSSWARLSATTLALLGPLRWILEIPGRMESRRTMHRLERVWATAMIRALDIRVTVSGLEKVDPGQHYVVAPLHESLIDPVVLTQIPLDLSFAVRDELFGWRFLGSYLRSSDQASISTRSGTAGYRALLRGAQKAFERNESFVVFPQGSILGIEAAFYPGPFRIAEKLGHPLLPIVISGTHRVWEHPYSPVIRRHRHVRLEILDPIPAARSVGEIRNTEREMKRIALTRAPFPRRYEPDRDGWWDEYPFRIDDDFEELAERVRGHRAATVR